MTRLTALTALATPLAAPFLAALLAACAAPPADLDLSLKHASVEGRFVVEMEPPAQGPAINRMHAWKVKVATPDGTAVTRARITVDGGMPQHGHGLPTRPRVTQEVAPGTYLVEGMKFSMTGWWDFRLGVEAAGARDTAVFNVIVEPAGVKR